MAQPIPGGPPAVTPLRSKLALGLGSLGESMALYAVTAFALLFYNQVLGLPAHLAGLALFVSLVFDGLSDPIVGSLSDRTRSKWGRRHPYLFAAPVPIAAGLIAMFAPPPGMGDLALFAWFTVAVILLRFGMTLYHVPHLAMAGELSSDYHERSRIMAFNALFYWAGGSILYLLAFAVIFAPTEAHPTGLLNPEPWPWFAVGVAAFVFVALNLSSWFTLDRVPFLPQPAADAKKFGLRSFFSDVVLALTNMNYVWFLIGYFFLSLTNGVRDGLWLYTTTFYWKLDSAEQAFFIFGSFAGFVFSFLFAAKLNALLDKKPTILLAGCIYCLAPGLPFVLGLAGIIGPDTPGLLWFLVAWTFLTHAPISVMTISVMSALADVADENELRSGLRQEGVLYSTRTLFGKIDQAVGAALAGAVLTWIAFPANAEVGAVAPRTLDLLAIAYACSGAPGLVAMLFYAQYKITRASNAAVKVKLAERAAAHAFRRRG